MPRICRQYPEITAFKARSMRKTTVATLFSLLMTVPMSKPYAVATDAVLTLPEADRIAIETSLGQGILGQPVSAPVINYPSHFFTLTPATKLFNVVHGPNAGAQQPYQFFPAPAHSDRAGWRYRAGDEEVGFLEVQDDGSLVMVGMEDVQAEALTHYDPPEPFLPRGLAPGDQRQVRMSVRVFAAGDANDITHRGELTVTYRYLGAYRLTVPAGTFNAVLTKSTFSGNV